MKKLNFAIVLISLIMGTTLAFCKSNYSNIAKKEFTIDPFTKLEIGGPFNVYIRQGTTEQVYIEADEKVINKIFVKTDNGTLRIESESSLRNVKRLDVYITLVKVDYMKFYDAGNIDTKGTLKLDNLEIDYSRTGNMDLNLECNDLKLDSRGTGNVNLKGSAKKAVMKHSGIGNFSANNFKVDKLKVSVSGVGNAEVYAADEISINVSGVGNFDYYGDAMVKDYKVSGLGNVSKH